MTQFCGCDYTALYSPLFYYTRFDHSLVVAHMTWHFTHDKKETLVALLHDVGTPCFAHVIDYLYGDFEKQESSERSIIDVIQADKELLTYLKEDGISMKDLEDCSQYPILENQSPRLCTDRLDGVIGTCYIWLHTHTLEEIKEVYENLVALTNEDGKREIGFLEEKVACKFVEMVSNYAVELQGNKDKFVMQFVADTIKSALSENLITIDDLYHKKESELVFLFQKNFLSWRQFEKATEISCTDELPKQYYVSVVSKKRNTIPLVKTGKETKRINEVCQKAKSIYEKISDYQDKLYGYVEEIMEISCENK